MDGTFRFFFVKFVKFSNHPLNDSCSDSQITYCYQMEELEKRIAVLEAERKEKEFKEKTLGIFMLCLFLAPPILMTLGMGCAGPTHTVPMYCHYLFH